MNVDDRLALDMGRLMIQNELKQAAIDDLMAKIAELERQVAELTPKQ